MTDNLKTWPEEIWIRDRDEGRLWYPAESRGILGYDDDVKYIRSDFIRDLFAKELGERIRRATKVTQVPIDVVAKLIKSAYECGWYADDSAPPDVEINFAEIYEKAGLKELK